MTVAAILAFAAAWAFALPEGYWAVISAVVVMQSSLGGTLGASLDRLMATVAGAMVGAACVFLRGLTPLPEILVLTLAVGPTALLAALRPSFRLAPITAVIVLVGASPGAGLLTAFHRVMEIALGCVIGALTAHLVLPDRARVAIKTGAAGMLDATGQGRGGAFDRRRHSTHRCTERVGAPAPECGRHSGGRGCTGAGALFADRPTGCTPVADLTPGAQRRGVPGTRDGSRTTESGGDDALKNLLAQEAAAPKKSATVVRSGEAKACRRCSGRQAGSEAGIIRRVVDLARPSLEVDHSPTFFEADLADKLLIIRKVAKLEVAHAAFVGIGNASVLARIAKPRVDRG